MTDVQIMYDDTDITEHVLFRTARFESQLGAQPGQFEMTIKDMNRTLSFVTGKRLTLTLDGTLVFGGFVLQVTKTFAVPADRTDVPVLTRQWILRGADYNILFDKRFMFNVAAPKTVIPAGPAEYNDAQILALMTSRYLDLSTDDIDVTTHVVSVGDPTPDAGATHGFLGVGVAWRREMLVLSSRTGAIWYLAPGSGASVIDLHFKGREVVTPDWGFSDQPDGVSTYGFRELDATEDATNLVNDGLVWSGSQFATPPALFFGRATDPTSIANLFRSQRAEARFGEFISDAACVGRANIIVFGRADGNSAPGSTGEDSADPARGLRNPQRQLRLAWFGDQVPSVLVPGSVVTVYLNSFSETITLPVRNIRITFPNLHPDGSGIVRFEGFLGVQTDDPFTLWKYMNDVAASGGTASGSSAASSASATGGTGSPTPPPTSDGSSGALVNGTRVAMTPTPAADGSTVDFFAQDAYQAGSMTVYLNGLEQRPGFEYTESDPVTKMFSFYDAPLTGDQLWIVYTSSGFSAPVSPSSSPPVLTNMATGLEADGYASGIAAEVKTAVDWVRLDTPTVTRAQAYAVAGLNVVADVVGPYNIGGVQALDPTAWANNALALCQAAGTAIKVLEILNEPGGQWFWGTGALTSANAAAYCVLIREVHDLFVAQMGAGRPLLIASWDGGQSYGSSWGAWMEAADPSIWTFLDGVVVHPYGGTGDPVASAEGNRANVTAANTATGLPVYLTEVGWPTAVGEPPTGDSLQWSEADQATNIYNFVNWARGTGYVALTNIFQYRDYGTNNWYGITRADGSHKPSFEALRLAARGL